MRPFNLRFINPLVSRVLVCALIFCVLLACATGAQAKTQNSTKAENLFFYVTNDQGQVVLLTVIPVSELRAMSHGQLSNVTYGEDTGVNYYFSCTDNFPTEVYTEAKGFTIPELVDYVKQHSTVPGVQNISYIGTDALEMMATDGMGIYSTERFWNYNELYGEDMYYFPGLFDATGGWTNGWEVNGTADGISYSAINPRSMPLNIYNTYFKDNDPYYQAKRDVFANGQLTTAIFAIDHSMERITDLEGAIYDNGGEVTGSMANDLEDGESLRLCIPQSEAMLMSGNRTAFHYFAWVYNVKLNMANKPALTPLGSVAAPTAEIIQDGDSLSITLDCATEGAQIYYSFYDDWSPQNLYIPGETLTYDIAGRDLSKNPIVMHITAVKEGYTDSGIHEILYPQRSPAFTTLTTVPLGSDLTYQAASGVSSDEWSNWANNINEIGIRYPGSSIFTSINANQYSVDYNAKTITLNHSLFTDSGSHIVQFDADGYVTKAVSVTMRKSIPSVETTDYYMGSDITLTFDDNTYQSGLIVNVKEQAGADGRRISPTYLDLSNPGQVTIKSSYFNLAACVIKNPGIYELTLTNNNYTPVAQTVTIHVMEESGQTDAFTFNLVPSVTDASVGQAFTVNASLSALEESFTFYSGEYRLLLDDTYLTLGQTTGDGLWQHGIKKENGQTILTFAALDMTGQGELYESETSIGNFTLTPVQAGNTIINCTGALLTNANAGTLSNVKGNGLELTINPGNPVVSGDINGDGVIDISDLMLVLNYITIYEPTLEQLQAADFNNDGVLDISDLMILINMVNND